MKRVKQVKLIFLDIDGVLNSHRSGSALGQKAFTPSGLDKIGIKLLGKLCKRTGAKIVISSTWRRSIGKTVEWWNGLFAAYNIAGSSFNLDLVIGLTPRISINNSVRGDEVNSYLMNLDPKVDRYVIFDDDSDFYESQPLIQIKGSDGILLKHIKEAEEVLGLLEDE